MNILYVLDGILCHGIKTAALFVRHIRRVRMQICGHFMLNILQIKQFMYHSQCTKHSHKFIWDWKTGNEIPARSWL